MALTDAFRDALCSADVQRCRELWIASFPNMPQPRTIDEAETMMHIGRTAADSVPLAKRLYSHAWLIEREYRSELPDVLKPKHEPAIIVPAVGVSVNSLSKDPDRYAEAKYIEGIMAAAAGDAMQSGITDPARVSEIMWQAKRAATGGNRRGRLF